MTSETAPEDMASEANALDVEVASAVLVVRVGSAANVVVGDSLLNGGLHWVLVTGPAFVLVASVWEEVSGNMFSVSDNVAEAPEFEGSTALADKPLVEGMSEVLGTSEGRPLVAEFSIALLAAVGEGTPRVVASLAETVTGVAADVSSAGLVVGKTLASVVESTVELVASGWIEVAEKIVSDSDVVTGASSSVDVDVGVCKPSLLVVVDAPFCTSVADGD